MISNSILWVNLWCRFFRGKSLLPKIYDMKNSNLSEPQFICPAQESWWTSEFFRSFYRVGGLSLKVDISQESVEAIKLENGEVVFRYKGETWVNSGLIVPWAQGQVASSQINGLVDWDHWHTTFSIHSTSIHIDFVSFFRMGPQTAYREYRAFANQGEIGRGGGFSGFLGGKFTRTRNWPLLLEFEDHLIVLSEFLQSWPGPLSKGVIEETDSCLILKK